MPFDGLIPDATHKLWSDFGHYARSTYRDNPRHLTSITIWHQNLFARRLKGEKLALAFVEVKNEITGRSFTGYRINRQMYFSRDPAVLTLPYPRTPADPIGASHPDRNIGVYLRDFGVNEDFFKHCAKSAKHVEENIRYRQGEVDEEFRPYLANIRRSIKQSINNRGLPGGAANNLDSWEFRMARNKPANITWHRDDDTRGEADMWARVLIHPLVGTGTRYLLDGNSMQDRNTGARILCPLGATSSHLAVRPSGENTELWGALHVAGGRNGGRAILIKEDGELSRDWERITDQPTPWRTVRAVCAL